MQDTVEKWTNPSSAVFDTRYSIIIFEKHYTGRRSLICFALLCFARVKKKKSSLFHVKV